MGLWEELGLRSSSIDANALDVIETSPTNEVPPDPDFSDSETSARVEHACENCGNDVQYSGRGRVPKKCPDCRANRTRVSSDGPAMPRMPRMASMDKRKQRVVDNLMQINGMMAGSLALAAPVTGNTMALTAPPAIVSLVEIASKYPKMMEGLEKLTEVMPWIDIARFAGAVGYAMAVDAGRIEPYGLVAEYLGVAEAAKMAQWEPTVINESDVIPNPAGPDAPASPTRFKLPDGA